MPSRSSGFPSRTTLAALLRTARRLAVESGERVRRQHRPRGTPTERKGEGDFVTATDIATERFLRRELKSAFPEHGFLGEEAGADRIDADFVWVVDPIDGTSNFSRGLTPYAVSVACAFRGRPVAAAAWVAPAEVVYSAAFGMGAFRGSRRLPRPRGRVDDGAIVGAQWRRTTPPDDFLVPLVQRGARIRNLGSTVAQVCNVAAGQLDANIQEHGRIWDLAAVVLIAAEAGARCTDWTGAPLLPFPRDEHGARHFPSLIAAPAVHRNLLPITQAAAR